MAVAYVTDVLNTNVNTTTVAVDLSGRSVGQLVLVWISRLAIAEPTTTPSGWTLEENPGATTGESWLYWKVLGSGDLITHSWVWASSVKTMAHYIVYSGTHATAPIGASNSIAEDISDTTLNVGSITSNEPWLVAFGAVYSSNQTNSVAVESGWTEQVDYWSTTSDWLHYIADTNGGWGGGTSNPVFDIATTQTTKHGAQVAINSKDVTVLPGKVTASFNVDANVVVLSGDKVEWQGNFLATQGNINTVSVDLTKRRVGELVFVWIARSVAAQPTSGPTQGGWTLEENPSSTHASWLYWKVLGSGDLSTHVWEWVDTVYTMVHYIIYTGADATSPIGTSNSYAEAVTDTTLNVGSITSNEVVLVAFGSVIGAPTRSINNESGWSERLDFWSDGSNKLQYVADTDNGWGGGSSNPTFDITISSQYKQGAQVAIVPAAGGGATATPATITETWSVRTPTLLLDMVFAVSKVSGTWVIPAPVIKGEAEFTATALSGVWSVRTPVLKTGVKTVLSAVSEAWTVRTPTFLLDMLFTVSEVSEAWTVVAPVLKTGMRYVVSKVSEVWTPGIPVLKTGMRHTTITITETWTVNVPSYKLGSKTAPAKVSEIWTVTAPGFKLGVRYPVSSISEAWTVNAPTIITAGGVVVAPAVVTETWTVGVPVVTAGGVATIVEISQHIDAPPGSSQLFDDIGWSLGQFVRCSAGTLGTVKFMMTSDTASDQMHARLWRCDRRPKYGDFGPMTLIVDTVDIPAGTGLSWTTIPFGSPSLAGGWYVIELEVLYGTEYIEYSTGLPPGGVWFKAWRYLHDGSWDAGSSSPIALQMDVTGNGLLLDWVVERAIGNSTIVTIPGGSLYAEWTPVNEFSPGFEVITDSVTVAQDDLDPLIWTQYKWTVHAPATPVVPNVIIMTWTVTSPALRTGARYVASMLAELWTVNVPELKTSVRLAVSKVSETWAVQTPSVEGDSRVAPAAIASTFSVAAPSVKGSSRSTVVKLAETWAVNAPSVKSGARPAVAKLTELWTVNTPTVVLLGGVIVRAPEQYQEYTGPADVASGYDTANRGIGAIFACAQFGSGVRIKRYAQKLSAQGIASGDVELRILSGTNVDPDNQTLRSTIPVLSAFSGYAWVVVDNIDLDIPSGDTYVTLAFINSKALGYTVSWELNTLDSGVNWWMVWKNGLSAGTEWLVDAGFTTLTQLTTIGPLEETLTIRTSSVKTSAKFQVAKVSGIWSVGTPGVVTGTKIVPAKVAQTWTPRTVAFKLGARMQPSPVGLQHVVKAPGFKLTMRFSVSKLPLFWSAGIPWWPYVTEWYQDPAESDTWTPDPAETDTWTLDPAEADSWTRGGE